ncbi:hypothetical protein V2H77_19855 [Photorhabdus sp. P32]
MANYRELLAQESPEMQARVEKRVEQASIKLALSPMIQKVKKDLSQAVYT